MAQRDLHVEEAGHGVAQQHVRHALGPCRDRRHEEREPREEPQERERVDPCPEAPVAVFARGQQEYHALDVEVEPCHAHDGVVPKVLVGHEDIPRRPVEFHDAPVVLVEQPPKHPAVDREDGQMGDVRVAVDRVGHGVVDVVRGLPPSDAYPVEESDERAQARDVDSVGGGGPLPHVPRVVADEGELLPEYAQEDRAYGVRGERLGLEQQSERADEYPEHPDELEPVERRR
mmetsp:Transcript_35886/g.80676  ORF Transcript_35886/g.80676 Transcript_35886/m.80676 type:complete len:231 (+) Transcript_35886:484-1176(+)